MDTNGPAGLAARLLTDSPDCRSRDVLDRLGSRWSVLIILNLATGTLRFTELRNRVRGITPKVLTSNLRDLERDGLISRAVFAEVPPRTEYTLTPLGESLITTYRAVQDWAEKHADEVLTNRDTYDKAR
jgi:DNA-binding HxlR family transcriptional regulator